MEQENYTMKQASEQIGIPIWTLRRMYRRGLIPYVRLNRVGRQVLSAEQVGFVKILVSLEKAGMSRRNIKKFAGLYRKGDGTLAERKAMLETQRRQFWQELEDLQQGIDVIERQIELIDTVL